MTKSTTTRLRLTRWSSDADEFTRADLDTTHANLETYAAGFSSGATLPTHDATYTRGFFLDTTTGILYYSTGSAWTSLNSYAAPVATITPGDTASTGTATTIAKSDHRHPMLPFATATPSTVTTTGTAGAANTYARGDHQHALAANAVTAGAIATGGVSAAAQLAANVVTTTAIADANVTRAKIATSEQIPTGTILPWVGSAADVPTGWVLCDGQTSVSAASALGILLGGASGRYGTSGGNPLVPDLRGKFPYGGLGASATWTSSGGATSVTLAANNLPSHTHDIGTPTVSTAPTHQHTVGTIANAATSVDHTHTYSHTHNVAASATNNGVDVISGGVLGTVLAITPSGTGGSYNISTTNGNTGQYTLSKFGTWAADVPSNITTSTSGSTSHTHALSGSTGSDGSHTHTLTGSTGANTTTGASFSIIPPFIGLSFIIKL